MSLSHLIEVTDSLKEKGVAFRSITEVMEISQRDGIPVN